MKRFKIKRTKAISTYRDVRYFIFQDDGDEDIVVCNNIGAPFFYQNQQREPNNWIRVRVVHRYVKGAMITDKAMPYLAQNGRALKGCLHVKTRPGASLIPV